MAWVTWRQHRTALTGVFTFDRRPGPSFADRRASVAPCLRRGDCLSSGELGGVQCHGRQLQRHRQLPVQWRFLPGRAASDRSIRRHADTFPRVRGRYLPLRLDPGLRPLALDARPVGFASESWWPQPALPSACWRRGTTSRISPRAISPYRCPLSIRSIPDCSTSAALLSPHGPSPPSLSASWLAP